MGFRRITFIILAVCALGLLILSCEKQSNVGSTYPQVASTTWPPDTMTVTLLGSGRLGIKACWKPRGSGGGVVPPTVYEVSSALTAPDTKRSVLLKHTPPDTTTAMLIDIIEQSRPEPSASSLLLVKWPPDTSGSQQ